MTNAEEQAAESDPTGYDIELFEGWNLVVLPGTVRPPTVAAVFGTGQARVIRGPVWAWDPILRVFRRVEGLTPFSAYWVYAPERATVTVRTAAAGGR